MPETRLAVVQEYLIPDMLLKPVGWFTPSPAYTPLGNTEYTLDLIGSSATSATVVVLVSATAGVYHFVYLTPTPTAHRIVFTTTASPGVFAFNMYANNINLTGVKLSYDVAGVTIPVGNSFGSPVSTAKQQLHERSSAGDDYIYTKANKRTVTRPLLFEGVNKATCDDVIAFYETTAEGTRYPFTLFDAYDVAHTVRFGPGGVQAVPIGGGFYELRMTVEEQL